MNDKVTTLRVGSDTGGYMAVPQITYADHLVAVEAAVIAEREACAATSDAYAKEIYFYANESQAVEVAKRIRARTTQPAEGSK